MARRQRPEAQTSMAEQPPKHTANSVAALITKNMEPQTAEDVLAALKPLDGQLITTRLLDKLPGGRIEWRLSRHLGWTEIKNRVYLSTGGEHREGVCLMLARSEASVPLSVEFVERENPAYFAGRRQRNDLRTAALANPELLTRVAFIMNEIEDINLKRTLAKKQFAAFVDHGEPLSPDQYALERACGLREEKK
jgi:hypothetical protein